MPDVHPRPLGFVKARRTDLETNTTWDIELDWGVGYLDGEPYIVLMGGPTGSESACLDTAFLRLAADRGWCACMGVEGSVHRLIVPAEGLSDLVPFLRRIMDEARRMT